MVAKIVISNERTEDLTAKAFKLIDEHPYLYTGPGAKPRAREAQEPIRRHYADLLVRFYLSQREPMIKTLQAILELRRQYVGNRVAYENYQGSRVPSAKVTDLLPHTEWANSRGGRDSSNDLRHWLKVLVTDQQNGFATSRRSRPISLRNLKLL